MSLKRVIAAVTPGAGEPGPGIRGVIAAADSNTEAPVYTRRPEDPHRDAEVDAIGECVQAMNGLNAAQQLRVLTYLADRFRLLKPAPQTPPSLPDGDAP